MWNVRLDTSARAGACTHVRGTLAARRTVVLVAAKQVAPVEGRERERQHLQLQRHLEQSMVGPVVVGSSIRYQIKPGRSGGPSDPVSSFIAKLRMAWSIFFPDTPPEVSPKEEGKNRLRMILVADRCGMSPAGLSEMKKTILKALEEYVDIESEEQIDVSITVEPQMGTVYCVAVPIKRVKPEARLVLGPDGHAEFDGLSLDYDPEDWNSDPSSRFPYGC